MEFQSTELNTEFSDFFPDEDEKRDKIKDMLKDLIKDSKKMIKETEKKCTEEKKLLQSLPKLPTGIKVKINRQKTTSKQQNVIQPTIKKSFPDPFKFKTNLPAGIKIVKLKKSSEEPMDTIFVPPAPPASTSLDYIQKLPSGIQIVKLNKNPKIAEKPSVPLNNFPKLPPGIKVTQLKKAPDESEKMEDTFIDDDFTFDSDFEMESSPIIDSNEKSSINTPLVEIKCGVCDMTFSSLEMLENHSGCYKQKTKEHLTVNSQYNKLKNEQTVIRLKKFKLKKLPVKKKVEPVKAQITTSIEPKSWSEDCLKEFESFNDLNQHELVIVNPGRVNVLSFVKCKICQAFHNNLDEMKEHIKQGHSEKQVDLANKRDLKIDKIKKMLKQDSKKYPCPLCDGIEFKTLKMYNKHIMEEHKTVEKFTCKICKKILLTEIALNSHLTLAHFNQLNKMHQCIHCDIRPFVSEDMLNTHIMTRHTELDHKPLKNTCEICGKLFKVYARKVRHVQQVHFDEANFFCDICGLLFKCTSKLTHSLTHTDVPTFECDQCGGRFRHNTDLTIHKRLHTGERPYECTICHERFVASSNLTKHLRSRHLVKTGILVE